jgi:GMP synthase-like glutamine amidotransferase
MKILCFQHVEFENPGYLVDWFKREGHEITYLNFYQKPNLAMVKAYDVLLIMGGPMGVYDIKKYPWLMGEKMFIQRAIQNGKKVIGICLGAQLIAEAMGAKVFPNKQKEIGWFPIYLNEEAKNHAWLSAFPDNELITFHWHGDTFELPAHALPIGHSEATQNQGFIWGNHVLALQFHPEITSKGIEALIENDAIQTVSTFVQTQNEIRSQYTNVELNRYFIDVLFSAFLS